jgi:hypothetical protein
MFFTISKTLAAGLRDHIRLSHSRLETLSWLVMLIIEVPLEL